MAYTKTVWKDRVVQNPRTYTKTDNADGSITLTPKPGVITEEGTPISAANMNRLENAVENIDSQLGDITQTPTANKIPRANNLGKLDSGWVDYKFDKIADIELTKSTLTVDFVINKAYDRIILSIYGSNSRFDSTPGASNSGLQVTINNLITLINVGKIKLATYSRNRGYLEVEIPGSCKIDNSGIDYKEVYCKILDSVDAPTVNLVKFNITDYYNSISTLSLSCNQGGFAPYTKIKVLGVTL